MEQIRRELAAGKLNGVAKATYSGIRSLLLRCTLDKPSGFSYKFQQNRLKIQQPEAKSFWFHLEQMGPLSKPKGALSDNLPRHVSPCDSSLIAFDSRVGNRNAMEVLCFLNRSWFIEEDRVSLLFLWAVRRR